MADLSWLERLRGKRTRDIRLPNEGTRDPRLDSPIPKVVEGIKGFKRMQDKLEKGNQFRKSQKDAILKGLREGY